MCFKRVDLFQKEKVGNLADIILCTSGLRIFFGFAFCEKMTVFFIMNYAMFLLVHFRKSPS